MVLGQQEGLGIIWEANKTSYACETLMTPQWPFFRKLWLWYLTLTNDLVLGTNKKVLSKSILMWKMKALNLTD